MKVNIQYTPSLAIDVKNAQAWASMVSYLKEINENQLLKRKKILGAVYDLPAK